MKHISKIFYMLLLAVVPGLTSCSDENEEARTPQAVVTVNQTDLDINESMVIHFQGVADQVVVYTGDESHDYSLRNESNTGFVVNKGLFTYSYSVPGTFKVVVLATTYDTYMGNGLRTDTTSFYVTVKDDVTELGQVYSTITPNVYYASLVNESDWVMCLPTKLVYNNREVTLNAKRQRLSFEIASDSSKIYVDDVIYSTKNYYDLTQPHDIRVESDFGSIRNYRLYTMIYPEFKSVKLNGVSGKLVRDAFNQDSQVYQFTLPKGTTGPVIEYMLDGDGTFLADGVSLESGSRINLDSSFTLYRVNADNDAVSATSNVRFEITYE